MVENIYKPHRVRIEEKRQETYDTTSFKLVFVDDEIRENFTYRAGNFGEYSVFGEGESTFCISSAPAEDGSIQCSFKLLGRVTHALRRLDVGDRLGFRGPYGNWFPLEEFKGRRVVIVGGGIGIAPLRPVIQTLVAEPAAYDGIHLLGAARTAADLPYMAEFDQWSEIEGVEVTLAVDPGGESADWTGRVGLAPNVLKELNPSARNAVALCCGPPIMIRFTALALKELAFDPASTYTTLENRMKCGIGKCGRCNAGPFYVCKDGPVLTLAEMAELPDDM